MMFSKDCRVCLKPAEGGSKLESRPGRRSAVTVGDMLRYCFPATRASVGDPRYPQQVCRACLRRLAGAYKLKRTHKHTHRQLIKQLRELKQEPADAAPALEQVATNNEADEDCDEVTLTVLSESVPDESQQTEKKKADKRGRKQYSCSVCELSIRDRAEWREHLKLHPHARSLCSYCGKGFRSAFALNVHIRKHTLDKPFACAECGGRFTQKHNLLVHERALHRKERPFPCLLCDARFPRKDALVIHTRSHAALKPYSCTVCGACFRQPANLSAHAVIHTGVKKHVCGTCGFRTAYSSVLKRHERGHDGARDHVCTLCDKTFRDKSTLTRHRRIHSGELPYACALCPRAFIDSWKRSQHAAKAHPANTSATKNPCDLKQRSN